MGDTVQFQFSVKRSHILYAILLISIIVTAFYGGAQYQRVFASPTNPVIQPLSMKESYDYVIGIDGTIIFARNGKTGEIDYSGTNATTVIQSAINGLGATLPVVSNRYVGGSIMVSAGAYTLTAGITFPSWAEFTFVSYGHLSCTSTSGDCVTLGSNWSTVGDAMYLDHFQFYGPVGGAGGAIPNATGSVGFHVYSLIASELYVGSVQFFTNTGVYLDGDFNSVNRHIMNNLITVQVAAANGYGLRAESFVAGGGGAVEGNQIRFGWMYANWKGIYTYANANSYIGGTIEGNTGIDLQIRGSFSTYISYVGVAIVMNVTSASNVLTINGGGSSVTDLGTYNQITVNGVRTQSYSSSGPSNKAGTTSASLVMLGLGKTYTVKRSSTLSVTIYGFASNTNATRSTSYVGAYGTGAAPVNGAAATGTYFGGMESATSATAGASVPIVVHDVISGLSAGTTYWFDLQFCMGGTGTSSIENVKIVILEIQ